VTPRLLSVGETGMIALAMLTVRGLPGGMRGFKQDSFRFMWVEGETVEKEPATDCCRAGGWEGVKLHVSPGLM